MKFTSALNKLNKINAVEKAYASYYTCKITNTTSVCFMKQDDEAFCFGTFDTVDGISSSIRHDNLSRAIEFAKGA